MIRKAAEFNIVGTEAKFTGYAVKCDLCRPEKLKPGFHITKTGMYIIGQPNGPYLVDFDSAAFDRTLEITQEHSQNVLNRVTGTIDVKIKKIHLASSFTDRSKQTIRYRKGRILLAGDAPHIHSPLGAQGLGPVTAIQALRRRSTCTPTRRVQRFPIALATACLSEGYSLY